MKKVLAATFVVALMAVTITGASADPAERLRANAYSIDLGGSLLPDLLSREGDVTVTLPPGGDLEGDVANADLQPLALEGAGITQVQAHRDSDISDEIVLRGSGFTPGAGGGAAGSAGLLGDVLPPDLLGGITGGLPIVGGGGGLPLGTLSEGDGGTVQAQQLPVPVPGVGGDGGLLGQILGGGLLGDVLGGGASGAGGVADENIDIPFVNGRAFASIDLTGAATGTGGSGGEGGVLGGLLGDLTGAVPLAAASEGDGSFVANQLPIGGTGQILTQIVFDALIRLGVIQSEAVVTCAGNTPVFDIASRTVESEGATVDVGETLNGLVNSLTDTLGDVLPGDLIDIQRGQFGNTVDANGIPNGVFVNALRVTVLGAIDETLPPIPGVGGALPALPGLTPGGGEPLIDLVLSHSEISGSVCAAAAAPPVIQPTGDDRGSLPRTGGGPGLLPAVLTLGLLGAAVTGGRIALRSRRSDSL